MSEYTMYKMLEKTGPRSRPDPARMRQLRQAIQKRYTMHPMLLSPRLREYFYGEAESLRERIRSMCGVTSIMAGDYSSSYEYKLTATEANFRRRTGAS